MYVQCASLLRSRIDNGQWPVGRCLPSHTALAAELGVALVTLRQAMSMLEIEGLLKRRQGAGTYVLGKTRSNDWVRLGATWEAMLASLRDVKVQLVNVRLSHLQPQLGADEGRAAEKYRFLSRLHQRDGRPFCQIHLYLDEDIFRLDPLRFDQQLVMPLLTELAADRIARAWQTIRMGKADPVLAERLAIDAGDPVAHVRRVVLDHAGTVIYLAEISYRADVVRIDMNLLDTATPPPLTHR